MYLPFRVQQGSNQCYKAQKITCKDCEVETIDENKVQIIEANEQEPEISVKCTRSKSSLYRKELFVICQKEGG